MIIPRVVKREAQVSHRNRDEKGKDKKKIENYTSGMNQTTRKSEYNSIY